MDLGREKGEKQSLQRVKALLDERRRVQTKGVARKKTWVFGGLGGKWRNNKLDEIGEGCGGDRKE